MFKTQDELKEFIKWAKAELISEVKIGEVHLVFSNLAFVDTAARLSQESESATQASKTPEQLAKEEEELLYHSAQ